MTATLLLFVNTDGPKMIGSLYVMVMVAAVVVVVDVVVVVEAS